MIASCKLKFLVIWFTCVLLYLTGGFLTYGYTTVRRDMDEPGAFMAGFLWPFYWFGRGVSGLAEASENLFKEAPPPKVER